jgi:hypothetical protein
LLGPLHVPDEATLAWLERIAEHFATGRFGLPGRLRRAIAEPALGVAVMIGKARQSRLGIHALDTSNAVRFGSNAPIFAELIWVDPQTCDHALNEAALGPFPRSLSGQVAGGDWDLDVRRVEEIPKVAFGIAHWGDGVPWEETGAYEYLLRLIAERGRPVDGCSTLDDIVARYARLDEIFDQVRRENRLRTRGQVKPTCFRERKGVYVHVGRGNQPIFGGGSNNRFAMARVLGLPTMPAQVGRVHREALPHWREVFKAGTRVRHG